MAKNDLKLRKFSKNHIFSELRRKWQPQFTMIDVQDIEEIIQEDIDSPIYAKFLEMEYNETVDDLIKFRKISDPSQLFQLFLTKGLNSKGFKRVQRKL